MRRELSFRGWAGPLINLYCGCVCVIHLESRPPGLSRAARTGKAGGRKMRRSRPGNDERSEENRRSGANQRLCNRPLVCMNATITIRPTRGRSLRTGEGPTGKPNEPCPRRSRNGLTTGRKTDLKTPRPPTPCRSRYRRPSCKVPQPSTAAGPDHCPSRRQIPARAPDARAARSAWGIGHGSTSDSLNAES